MVRRRWSKHPYNHSREKSRINVLILKYNGKETLILIWWMENLHVYLIPLQMHKAWFPLKWKSPLYHEQPWTEIWHGKQEYLQIRILLTNARATVSLKLWFVSWPRAMSGRNVFLCRKNLEKKGRNRKGNKGKRAKEERRAGQERTTSTWKKR